MSRVSPKATPHPMPLWMNEFERIARCFAPLAEGFAGSFRLTDDAALLTPPAGMELVVTKDAISEGIHFIGSEDPALIARKLLRTNLSDLAAKGAAPWVYFLAVMVPRTTPPDWFARFADGLATDQREFGIQLAGGDTTATQSGISLSLTAIGCVPSGQMLRRNGARAGDIIVVSGTLSDSALGLRSLQGTLPEIGGEQRSFLQSRYLLPQPRMTLGLQLRALANACMDISDGLVQDLGHLCKTSGCGAIIEVDKLPISPAAKETYRIYPQLGHLPLNGGDDYELLFTVPAEKASRLPEGCTAIGRVTEGSRIALLDAGGGSVHWPHAGFSHF
jgi:thiamine-monophosphate kinase